MSVKYLPVLAAVWMIAACSRQQGTPVQTATTTRVPSQAAAPATAGTPEPVDRTVPPPSANSSVDNNAQPPLTGRAVDDRKPPAREAYNPSRPNPAPELTIPASTPIRVRLGESLDTRNSRPGERFTAYLDEPIVSGNRVILPKGTLFRGHVVEARRSGRLKGRAYLGVTLDSFHLNGTTYAINTRADVRASGSHKKRNLFAIGGGTGTGAAIGGIAAGGVGALIGAGAGAAAGTTGALITGKKDVRLPVETPLTFALRNPVSVRG